MLLNDYRIASYCGRKIVKDQFGKVSCTVIESLVTDLNWKSMIVGFVPHQVRELEGNKIISYGLSSSGYDARIGTKFRRFHRPDSSYALDPKKFKDSDFIHVEEDEKLVIMPNHYILGHTVEYFNMPQNVSAFIIGKSTYARSGLIVNTTPIEPGFSGDITIELSNPTNYPIIVYPNEGICQIMFFESDTPIVSYSDRNGKYMNQKGTTLPRV